MGGSGESEIMRSQIKERKGERENVVRGRGEMLEGDERQVRSKREREVGGRGDRK